MSATENLDVTRPEVSRAPARMGRVRFALLIALLAIIVAAVYAHIKLGPFASGFAGALALLDRVFDISVAASLLAICYLTGRAAASRLSLDIEGQAEETAFSIASGAGVLGLCLFLLGVIGALTIIPVSVLLAVLCALSLAELRRNPRRVAAMRLQSDAPQIAGSLIIRIFESPRLLLTAFGLFISLLMLRALTPPFDWADMVVHFPASKAFAEQGRIVALYDNPRGNDPFLAQMLYVVCIMVKTDIAPKLINLGLGIACNVAVYAFAARFIARRAALLAIVIFWGAQAISEVVVGARIDATLALFFFLAVYALARWSTEKHSRWLIVSASMCGFALGVSHAGIYWLVMLGVFVGLEGRRRLGFTGRQIAAQSLLFFGLALAIGSPWYIKNIIYFNNPVYPLITGEAANYREEPVRYFDERDERKVEVFYEEALRDPATKGIDPAVETVNYQRTNLDRNPIYFWRLFTYPERMSTEADLFPNYLFLILPVYIFLRKNRFVNWTIWLALGLYLSVCLPYRDFSMLLLLPAFPGLTVAAAYCIHEMTQRLKDHSKLPLAAVASALAILTVVSIAAINIQFLRESNTLSFIRGEVSRAQFLAPLDYYRPLHFIGHSLPDDAKVMLFNSQYYYGAGRAGIENAAGSLNTPWKRALVRADSLASLHDSLKAEGITHFLVDRANFIGIGDEQKARQAIRNMVIFKSYQQRYLEKAECGLCGIRYSLYRLK